jgi:signal transduction histidine kinase
MDLLFKSPQSQLFGLTIFFSILIFQTIFVFVQWIYKRRADYLFYIAYISVTGLFGLSLYKDILTFSPFDKIPYQWYTYGEHMLSLLAIILYFKFSRSFIGLEEKRPNLNKKVKLLEYGLIVYQMVSVLFIFKILPQKYWGNTFMITSILTILAAAYIISNFLKKSDKLEKYTLVAASFLVLGSIFDVTLTTAQKLGIIIPCDPHLPLLIFVFAEILTFTTGLTYKTRLLEINQLNTENQLLLKKQEIQQVQNDLLVFKSNLSKNLHDDMGARLSLINITIQQYFLTNTKTNKDDLIEKCSLIIKQSISYLRDIMNEMQGSPAVNEGYLNSIKNLTHSIQQVNPIRFHLNHSNFNLLKNPTVEYHLHKITLELINNTLKYAEASNIFIDISINHKILTFVYKDDGLGFNLDLEESFEGNGIMNIKERVRSLTGESTIESSAKNGFYCRIKLPIND